MTDSKKIKILQEHIDNGKGDYVIINVVDALDKEMPIREKVTIAQLAEKVKNGENLNEYPNFKEIKKAIEKEKPFYINGVFKDSLEKYLNTLKKENKLGSPDDAYNKDFEEKID